MEIRSIFMPAGVSQWETTPSKGQMCACGAPAVVVRMAMRCFGIKGLMAFNFEQVGAARPLCRACAKSELGD